MRNSSLVEGSCAENVTGLKSVAEAVDVQVSVPGHGRGAFLGRRRQVVRLAGARGSENPGMSSVNQGENP